MEVESSQVKVVETDIWTDNSDYTDEDSDTCLNVHSINPEYFLDAVHIDNVSNSNSDDFYIDMVLTNSRDWKKFGLEKGNGVYFKPDFGAQVNIIPEDCLKNGSYTLKKDH